jgi:diketogulonate reductase-like aldo/keto reductase
MDRRTSLRLLGSGLVAGAPARAASAPAPLARPIPSTGGTLPVIGMGTWQTFDVADPAPLEEVLKVFFELGGRLLDSSPMYGRSEQVAGRLIEKLGLGEKFFVATKVWTKGRAEGIQQMEASMAKLGARPIDLMQVHNLVDVATHLDTLRGWKKDGIVRHLGITHYSADHHEAVAKLVASETLDFVQINYSVGEREAENRLLPLAKDRGVAVIANRPFAGGELFGRLRGKPLPVWAKEIGCDSWAQLLLKFVVSHPAVTCAIPATSKVAHLRDNMKAGHGMMPDEEFRRRIAADAMA